MASTFRAIGSSDDEIERLKFTLVSEDSKGHSCQYCSVLSINFRRLIDGRVEASSDSYLDTTEREVRRKAKLGCSFWAMICDRLAQMTLTQKAKNILGGMPDDLYFSTDSLWGWRNNRFLEALEGEEKSEFLRLWRKSGVDWHYAFERPCDGLDFASSLRNQSRENAVSSDLLRLNFFSNGDYFRLYLTFGLFGDASFLVLIPPSKKFGINAKRMDIASPMNLEPSSPMTVDLIKCWLQKWLAWKTAVSYLSYDNKSVKEPSWSWASYIGTASWNRGECKRSLDFQVVRFSELPVDPFRESGSIEIHIRGLLMPFSYNFYLHNEEYSVEMDDDVSKNPELTVLTDYYEDSRFGDSPETEIHLLPLIVTCSLKVQGLALIEDAQRPGKYLRVGLFIRRRIWAVPDDYPEDHDIEEDSEWPDDAPEDYQSQLRSAFGGEKNIKEIILI
ncbi:hypothetical protein CGCF413_v003370 [Colletotrichum fructicola]|nr:hypothetical protein CGCF413_v003370 [Colletotrichum fructicola]